MSQDHSPDRALSPTRRVGVAAAAIGSFVLFFSSGTQMAFVGVFAGAGLLLLSGLLWQEAKDIDDQPPQAG